MLFNVWSNAQAVEDYKDYLSGIAAAETEDTDAVIVVGAGEHERSLAKCLAGLNPRGFDATLRAGELIPEVHPVTRVADFPVYLCVSAVELVPLLDGGAVPTDKRDDLVFLSDGFLEPILKARGLCRKENTQAVLWLRFTPKFGTPICGRTSMGENANGVAEWCGESVATGKWAGALVERLSFGRIYCRIQFYRDWRRNMLEKVAYLATMNLVGALHPPSEASGTDRPTTHRDVALYYHAEVDEMVAELSYTLRGYMAVTLLIGAVGRIISWAEGNGDTMLCKLAPEAFPFTNGLFWDNALLAKERGFPDTCPMHTEYLEYGHHKGYFTLPAGTVTSKLEDFE